MDEVRRMAAYLKAQDWPAGSHVVILSKNCAWWVMAELAVWMAGHLTVPIYPSLSSSSVRLLLSHCDPVACFVGAVDDQTILEQGVPADVRCIRFPNAPASAAVSWETIVRDSAADRHARASPDDSRRSSTRRAHRRAQGRDVPFGASRERARDRCVSPSDPEDRMISYLPLAHIAEALVEAGAFAGCQVFFVERSRRSARI